MNLRLSSRGRGNFIDAQIAFEHSLRIVEHDREHVEGYISALDAYAGLYLELGQFDVGVPMCRTSLRLRNVVASGLVGGGVGAGIGYGDLARIRSGTKGQTAWGNRRPGLSQRPNGGPSFPVPKPSIVRRADRPTTSPISKSF